MLSGVKVSVTFEFSVRASGPSPFCTWCGTANLTLATNPTTMQVWATDGKKNALLWQRPNHRAKIKGILNAVGLFFGGGLLT